MSKHLARDSSLWNRIMYGYSRAPIDLELAQKYAGDAKNSTTSEKSPDPAFHEVPSFHPFPLRLPERRRNFGLYTLLLAALLLIFFSCKMCPAALPTGSGRLHKLADFGTGLQAEQTKTIFEVSNPFVPPKLYGDAISSRLVLNASFDSYGHPAHAKLKAPKRFNRVIFTVNTTVSGVQYDRLAHLYVGGAEIWRFSTMEPGGKLVQSLFKKDVLSYLSLLEDGADVTLQLDNVVTDKIDGVFSVELYVDFYNDAHSKSQLDDKYRIFDVRGPAAKVYPLVDANPPLESLPGNKFGVSLPKVPQNTTRLKLAVFVSGNANEEFWYSNVLDKYVNAFQRYNNTFLGHGPTRFLNVYYGGKKIASQTPEPFIFTGGISPALWSPMVGIDAFDLPSLDIDVSGLLPFLWDGSDDKLELVMSNGVDEFESTESGVGENWILSANLLTYESSEVKLAVGLPVHIGNRTRGNTLGIAPPFTGSLQQIVNGILQAELTSALQFFLKDGTSLSTTVSTYTTGEISNVQLYAAGGNVANVVHVGHNAKLFVILDRLDNDAIIHSTNISLSYPLVLHTKQSLVEDGYDLDVKLVHVKETTLDINGKRVMLERNEQNGTSLFHARNLGNRGEGALRTHFKLKVDGPRSQYAYIRQVDTANGEVVDDHLHFDETLEWAPFAQSPMDPDKMQLWVRSVLDDMGVSSHSVMPCPGTFHERGPWEQLRERFEALVTNARRRGFNLVGLFRMSRA